MKLKSLVLLSVALLLTINAQSQDWGAFGKALTKEIGKSAGDQRAKLDSSDFQFAMTVNDNTALLNVKLENEGTLNKLQWLKEEEDITKKDIARRKLDSALVFYDLKQYEAADLYLQNAKTYMEAEALITDVNYVRCISNIGLLDVAQGRTEMAEKNIGTALEISRTLLTENSVAYASNLNTRAKLDQQIGKYNEAEAGFDQAEVFVIKKFGDASLQSATILNNKAMLYLTMGRYERAVEAMKQSSAVAEKALAKSSKGKNSFENRRFLSNLAQVYHVSGNLLEAEKTYLGIKKIYESRGWSGQKATPDYAGVLNQLGMLYVQMGKFDQVEPLLLQSAQIFKSKFTEESPSYAKVQHDLGTYYRIVDKFDLAEPAMIKARDIRLRTLGEFHPEYVRSVEGLGLIYWKKGDVANAYPLLEEGVTKSLKFISDYFAPMSEAEKAKYWDLLQPRFLRFYDFAMEASTSKPEILKEVYDYQIATKALLLNSTNKIKKQILSSGDNSLIADYLSWIAQKETLSRYYALSKAELTEQKIDLAGLEKSANDMERSLSQRSGDFSKGYTASKITFSQVASVLAENEAVVELIRVRKFDKDFTDQTYYVALTLTRGATTPKLAILSNGNEIETRYAKFYKNAILQRLEDPHSYTQFWGRIEPLIAGKKVIYMSPDGVYNQINVNTLKKTDGTYLTNACDVVVIGNSKDMLAIKSKKAIVKKDAFLLGFPDFEGAAPALPGTKVEIDGVSKVLKASGYQVTQRDQKNATEANLKAVKGPALVHIATHGYFLADKDLGAGSAMGVDAENAKNNPLLRSGLILSGVPDASKEEEKVDLQSNDNGILTAYEAMNLNLEGTDLIVLSACETGLGEVKAGEGVYGLQRAFMVAGANTLIMSLWKVDDAATQALMTSFYTNWTKSGNKLRAFKQAQLQLMTKYKDPYYWGAFVMMGM